MREILFRGKRIDNGEWVEGMLVQHHEEIKASIVLNHFGVTEEVDFICVDPSTIGQYTGINDRNGKRIFEGDVCRFREWENGDMCWIGAVCFEHQQFVIIGGPNKECETSFHLQMSRFVPRNIERIGTVHDNTELMEVHHE